MVFQAQQLHNAKMAELLSFFHIRMRHHHNQIAKHDLMHFGFKERQFCLAAQQFVEEVAFLGGDSQFQITKVN